MIPDWIFFLTAAVLLLTAIAAQYPPPANGV